MFRLLPHGLAPALLLALAPAALAQRDYSQVELKLTPVAGNVHLLEGAGGNIGVSVGPDGLLIVDDQYAPLAPKIEAALQKLHKGPLKFVLNTHWHGDHVGGNEHFGRQAPIIAHTNVRKRLAEAQTPPTPAGALPVITFDESLSLHFNGEEIRVIHLPPGHTDGDSVVHFTRSGVVHMGDQMFNKVFPFIDLKSGGTVEGFTANVARVLDRVTPEMRIIPGHGPLATRDDLVQFHRMLVETTGGVRQALAAGKTLEQVKAAGLPAEWSSWSWNFIPTDRWLEIVYQGLSAR